MSQAFRFHPVPIDLEVPRPITAPPTANVTPPPDSETGRQNIQLNFMLMTEFVMSLYWLKYSPLTPGDLASLKEVTVTPAEDSGGSSAPVNMVRFADLSFKRSYSYGVLEKKWSL